MTSKQPSIRTLFLVRFLPLALLCSVLSLLAYEVEYTSQMKVLKNCEEFNARSVTSQIPTKELQTDLNNLISTISFITALLLLFVALGVWNISMARYYQKCNELLIRQQFNSIKLLLDSTLEGIYGINVEGRCILANRACAQLLGYAFPDELLGKEMHQLMHHSHADGTPYPVSDCRAHRYSASGSDKVLVDDEVFWRKDGSFFPVSYTAHPIVEDGQRLGIVCTFVDISERRQLEDQLRHAQKMEAIGQLAGGVAHDFNNILQIISGNAQLEQHENQNQQIESERIKDILRAVNRGTNLTKSMLAFSRKQTMFKIPLELNQLVKDSELLAQKLLPENIKLHLALSETNLVITADDTLLQQVIFNLLTNARDAMPQGGSITVSTTECGVDAQFIQSRGFGKAGNYAVLSVKDTGQGISEQIRHKIFDPFFTTKGVGAGTGLGLAMVYGTVKQHDGFILLESEEGVGSTFELYLPCM
jgi:two-component system, cell cycle sensor histidine kinase and response regulator CckA